MQKLIFSKRIYPSGKPLKKIWKFNVDNSWKNEWLFFKKSIKSNKNKFDYSEGISNMQYLNLIRNKK